LRPVQSHKIPYIAFALARVNKNAVDYVFYFWEMLRFVVTNKLTLTAASKFATKMDDEQNVTYKKYLRK
jgi:hypothetical protein